jgi:ubiquinone biosynthesis protein
LHVDSGWVPAGTRVDEFESAVRTVCEPIFNKPLREISFGQVLLSLFETARRFDMTVQPQLVLLQKTLLQIEGLGRQLYPDLDLWKTAQPILQEWMHERIGWRGTLASLKQQWPDLNEALKTLPALFSRTVEQLAEGSHRVRIEQPDIEGLRREIRDSARARDITIIAGVALGAAIAWLVLGQTPAWGAAVLVAGGLIGLLSRRR